MAENGGTKIGTMFAEIDLDRSKYDAGLERALGNAKSVSIDIEKAWRTMGTKSTDNIDKMRANVVNAYELIRNKSTSTTEDILRAEIQAKSKLESINKRYYGSVIDHVKDVETEAKRATGVFTEMFGALTLANVATDAIYALGRAMKTTFTDAFNSVEEFRLSSASLGATIATFAKTSGRDMAEVYKQSYAYAEQLNMKMEEWNAKTVATGENLRAMVETMAQAGILVDINNKAQEKGIIAIANALAIVTQGQEQDKQFRQETRGLLDGEVRFTNRLSVMIDSMVDGPLTKQVEKWREAGTLIENLGTMLTGFTAATSDLESTWLAVSTTMETVYHRVLRGMFVPVYDDIVGVSKEFTLELLDQESKGSALGETLRTVVYRAWIDIKNITSAVGETIAAFEVPLRFMGTILGLALDGWGQILALLEPVYARITNMVGAMWELVEAAGNYGKMLYMFSTLRFDQAWQAWEDTKESWNQAGKKTGNALAAGFFDEIENKLLEYNKKLKGIEIDPNIKAPEMMGIDGKTGWEEYEKSAITAMSNALESKKKMLADYIEWAESANKTTMEHGSDAAKLAAEEEYSKKREVIAVKEAEIQAIIKKSQDAISRESEKALNERTRINDAFEADFLKTVQTRYEYEINQLELWKSKYEKAKIDQALIDYAYAVKKKKIEDEEYERKVKSAEKALEDFFKDIDAKADAEQDAYDDRLKAEKEYQDEQKELREDAYKDFSDTIQENTADILRDWDNAWETMTDIMKDALIEMAAEALTTNIIVPIAMEVGSAMGLSWNGVSMSSMQNVSQSGDMLSTGSNMLSAGKSLWGAYSGGIFDTVYSGLGSIGIGAGMTAGTGTGVLSGVAGGGMSAVGGAGAGTTFAAGVATATPYIAAAYALYTIGSSLFKDDPNPLIKMGSSTGGFKSDWGYGINPDDMGNQDEIAPELIEYFDNYFQAIDDEVAISLKDVLVNADFRTVADLSDFDTTAEAFAAMTNDIFKDIRASLIDNMSLDAGVFDQDFFESIAGEGGDWFAAFIQFEDMATSFADFGSRINDQLESGVSVEQAYGNLQLISEMLDMATASMDSMASSSTITALEEITNTYGAYIESMESSMATQEEITTVQDTLYQEIGSSVTGLTADSFQAAMIEASQSGGSVTESIKDMLNQSMAQAVAASASEAIFEAFLGPINEQIGEAVVASMVNGAIDGAILAASIGGIIDGVDWEAIESNISSAMSAIDVFTDESTAIYDTTVAEDYANTSSLVNDQKKLEIELMELQGLTTEALAASRELELESLDISLHATQEQIWALEDLADAAELAADALEESINAIKTKMEWDIELLNAQGKTEEAVNLQRIISLETMDAEYMAIQKLIWSIEDKNDAEEAAAVLTLAHMNLNIELLNAQGESEKALAMSRQLELDGMDEVLWAKQRMIWALEEEAEAEEAAAQAVTDAEDAVISARGEYITALQSEYDALQDIYDTAKTAYVDGLQTQIDAMAEAQESIQEAYNTATAAYIDGLQAEIDAQSDLADAAQDAVDAFTDLADSIADAKNQATDDMALLPNEQYALARAKLQDAAKLTTSSDPEKVKEGLSLIPGLTSEFLSSSLSGNTDIAAYQADYAYVMQLLNNSSTIALSEAATAQDALDEAEKQVGELEDILDYVENGAKSTASLLELETEYNSAKQAFDDDWYGKEIATLEGILDFVENGAASTASLYELETAYNDAKTKLDESWYDEQILALEAIDNAVLALDVAQEGYFSALTNAVNLGSEGSQTELSNILTAFNDLDLTSDISSTTNTTSTSNITNNVYTYDPGSGSDFLSIGGTAFTADQVLEYLLTTASSDIFDAMSLNGVGFDDLAGLVNSAGDASTSYTGTDVETYLNNNNAIVIDGIAYAPDDVVTAIAGSSYSSIMKAMADYNLDYNDLTTIGGNSSWGGENWSAGDIENYIKSKALSDWSNLTPDQVVDYVTTTPTNDLLMSMSANGISFDDLAMMSNQTGPGYSWTGSDIEDYLSTRGFADGGTVFSPMLAMVGEGGQAEHITPDSQMKGVKEELKNIKKVLEMVLSTNGDQNKFTKKMWRILDDSQRGERALTTEAAA